jgi:hypothetical protein
MRCDPLGSIWRRWDLHFHTPSSFDYDNKSLRAEDLVEGLVAKGVSVVAVTDHHVIDPAFVRKMQVAGAGRLTVLPGIELRSELGGSEHVHYIGIFPEDGDVADIWIKLQGLGISSADVQAKGDEHVYVPFIDGCARIHELGGIVTVHAGKKSNSIEQLTNADAVKRSVKSDLARHIDAFEVAKVGDCAGYREKVFPSLRRLFPLLMCSDNHDIAKYRVRVPMWIKADPGFLGLRQLINEPESRLFLGDRPPSFSRIELQATKYMTRVAFSRTTEARESDKWFEGHVVLNPGLVAIIGKKGGGKSALADILALLGDTRAAEHFGFLKNDRFLSPKAKLGTMFEAEVLWQSGRRVKRLLAMAVDEAAPESVKYIPQNYLETICAGVSEASDDDFDAELNEVIFSHVDEAQRLGHDKLADLIDALTGATEARIRQLLGDLSSVNIVIVALELEATQEHRASLLAQLEQRKTELATHDAAAPQEVPEPESDPETQAESSSVSAALAVVQEKTAALSTAIGVEKGKAQADARRNAAANNLLGLVANLQRAVEGFYAESRVDAATLGLDLQAIASLTVDIRLIEAARTDSLASLEATTIALDPKREGSLGSQLAGTVAEGEALRARLDEPNRRFQQYLQDKREWESKRAEIEGTGDLPLSLRGVAAKVTALDELPKRLQDARQRRDALSDEVFEAKQNLLEKHRALYAHVQSFIDNHPISKQQNALKVEASIAVDRFSDELLEKVHQGRKGSFQGEPQGSERLKELIANSEFTTLAGVHTFLANVLDQLNYDRRDGGTKPVRLRDQLRQNVSVADVYDFLFGLGFLKPRFELRWHGKPLDQLSPGERGNLLLLFYLLIDKRDTPLIIDQPEENLDNQTIAGMLVPAIKEAKERRQIVIVTHNPNLAVVCDADQVIHAQLDKTDGNRVRYTSGAIENPEITQLILDVLEGTKPAFDLRDAKYGLLERVS